MSGPWEGSPTSLPLRSLVVAAAGVAAAAGSEARTGCHEEDSPKRRNETEVNGSYRNFEEDPRFALASDST